MHAPAVGSQITRVVASTDGNPGQPVRHVDHLTMAAQIAWLAFCSGPCLKHEGRELFPPSDLWKELVNTQRFSDKTVTFDDTLGLPKALSLYIANGQPVLRYFVTSSTNVLGWQFPLEFRMAQYRPAPLPEAAWMTVGTNGWELELSARGRVTAAAVGTEPRIPPNVLKAASK